MAYMLPDAAYHHSIHSKHIRSLSMTTAAPLKAFRWVAEAVTVTVPRLAIVAVTIVAVSLLKRMKRCSTDAVGDAELALTDSAGFAL